MVTMFFFWICQTVILIFHSVSFVSSGWVDPDTNHEDKEIKSYVNNEKLELVFSDEFNVEGKEKT